MNKRYILLSLTLLSLILFLGIISNTYTIEGSDNSFWIFVYKTLRVDNNSFIINNLLHPGAPYLDNIVFKFTGNNFLFCFLILFFTIIRLIFNSLNIFT